MSAAKNNRGVSVIAVVIMMLILAAMGAAVVSLVATENDTSVRQMRASQAQYIAGSGMEYALYQFKTGTACASLSYSNITSGAGSFTTTGTLYNPTSTTLSGAITNSVTTIPVVSTTGYASHGRITIDSESIDYSGISGSSFTGARRGVAGTTAASHLSGASVAQNECLIQSTGTVSSAFGNATRVLETAAQASAGSSSSAFLNGGAISVGTSATTLGSLATTFPAGDNLIIAVIALRSTTNAADVDFAAGGLALMKGAATLTSNVEDARVGISGSVTDKEFPSNTQFLLYKDTGAAANPTYSVTALASATGVQGEVKLIAIHAAPNSSFQSGADTTINNNVNTTLLTHNSTVPAGDNVIIAAVQLYSSVKDLQNVALGGLKLVKGGTTLTSNQMAMNLGKPNQHSTTGYLLLYKDAGASASPTYSVTCLETNVSIQGAAQIIVLNGLSSAFTDVLTPGVAIGTSMTTIGTLNTTFPAGEMVSIASDDFTNTAAGQVNILAGNEQLVAGATSATSQFDLNLCGSSLSPKCQDFPSGNLLRIASGATSQTFLTQAQASASGISGVSKILAISMGGQGLTVIDWREVFP